MILKNLMTVMLLLPLCSCTTSAGPANTYRKTEDASRPLVDSKYSLSGDRKAMEDIRQDIPPDKKQENDELAFVLGLLTEVKRKPTDIRSTFDQAVRKKRSLFDKDMKKEREEFTKSERKNREQTLKDLQKQRTDFMKEKHSREERAEFFKDLDAKRSEFTSRERDKRSDFESDFRERRKSFEDYLTEKRNFFNEEHRAYVKKYDQWKKEQTDEKKNPDKIDGTSKESVRKSRFSEMKELDRELQEIGSKKGTSLESGE